MTYSPWLDWLYREKATARHTGDYSAGLGVCYLYSILGAAPPPMSHLRIATVVYQGSCSLSRTLPKSLACCTGAHSSMLAPASLPTEARL